MTETSPLFSFTYALQLLYWLIVYGLAGYAVQHLVASAVMRQRQMVRVDNRARPKRRR